MSREGARTPATFLRPRRGTAVLCRRAFSPASASCAQPVRPRRNRHLSYNTGMHIPDWMWSHLFRFVFSWYERRGKVKRLEIESADCKQELANAQLFALFLSLVLGIWILYASRNAMTRA